MPIPLPRLDDKTYSDLLDASLKLIPSLYPEWTNFNESDPGVTLTELFAWLTEMLLYRLDQIPPANYRAFLNLLDEPIPRELDYPADYDSAAIERALDSAIYQAVLNLRTRYRAVTSHDYESLLLNEWQASPEAPALSSTIQLLRVYCVPRRDLSQPDQKAYQDAPAHLSLILVARWGQIDVLTTYHLLPGIPEEQGVKRWLDAVGAFLETRRLLTTRLHIVLPKGLGINLSMKIKPTARPKDEAAFKQQVLAGVRALLHPVTGGKDGRGWPLGRDLYLSEIYPLIDRLPGVDFVTELTLTAPGAPTDRVVKNAGGDPIGVALMPDEFPGVADDWVNVTVLT